ncbi:MAG: MFS transporter [Deltaproteobacteria bacterium]|jgi:predicted MFS family arabinose efflux permease|nr:MFS transporter [Deltaproteobacteria bacterium]
MSLKANQSTDADQTRNTKSVSTTWFVWAAAALLAACQIVYLSLSFSTIDAKALEARLLVNEMSLKRLASKLETVTSLGLRLENYIGLEQELLSAQERDPTVGLLVASASGQILAHQGPTPKSRSLPNPSAWLSSISSNNELSFKDSSSRSWMGKALFLPDGSPAGYVVAPKPEISSIPWGAAGLTKINLFPLALTLTLSSLILASVLKIALRISLKRLKGPRLIYFTLLGAFFVSQALLTLQTLPALRSINLEQNRAAAGLLIESLAADLDKIAFKGLAPNQIADLPRYLEKLRLEFPILEAIAVRQSEKGLTFGDKILETAERSDPELIYRPLKSGGEVRGSISKALSGAQSWELLLDNASLTLVSGLALLELIRLLLAPINLSRANGENNLGQISLNGSSHAQNSALCVAPSSDELNLPTRWRPELVRPLVFLTLTATDMSLSFLPLKSASLNPNFLWFPTAVLYGLPISMEVAMAGLAMCCGGALVAKLPSWRPLFVLGLTAAALGCLLSGLVTSIAGFIAARSLTGLGYGFFNISASVFLISASDPNKRGQAMGDFSAGLFSGGLCGCLVGGLLAERFGFDTAFFTAAAILAFTVFISLIVFPSGGAAPKVKPMRRIALAKLNKFLFSPGAITFSILSLIPSTAALVGLLNYLLPLRVSDMGSGPAAVSRLNLLFSLIVVILGPILGAQIDRSRRPALFFVLSGCLSALAIPTLVLWPTMAGAVLCLVFLGLANSITESGHPVYLLKLPQASLIGPERAMSLYSGLSKLGQTLGPLLLGAAWSSMYETGLAALAAMMLVASLLFYPLSLSAAKAAKKDKSP